MDETKKENGKIESTSYVLILYVRIYVLHSCIMRIRNVMNNASLIDQCNM